MTTQNTDRLKAMLQDIINGREEQAAVTMHDYFVTKTREVAGLASTPPIEEIDSTETDTEIEDPEVTDETE